jgi:hypothetical protein
MCFGTQFGAIARTLRGMATKTKVKICVHCGHMFDPHDRHRDLANPYWFPAASKYCSPYCSDRYHLEMMHCCSVHVKEKARREAARAAR